MEINKQGQNGTLQTNKSYANQVPMNYKVNETAPVPVMIHENLRVHNQPNNNV